MAQIPEHEESKCRTTGYEGKAASTQAASWGCSSGGDLASCVRGWEAFSAAAERGRVDKTSN